METLDSYEPERQRTTLNSNCSVNIKVSLTPSPLPEWKWPEVLFDVVRSKPSSDLSTSM